MENADGTLPVREREVSEGRRALDAEIRIPAAGGGCLAPSPEAPTAAFPWCIILVTVQGPCGGRIFFQWTRKPLHSIVRPAPVRESLPRRRQELNMERRLNLLALAAAFAVVAAIVAGVHTFGGILT